MKSLVRDPIDVSKLAEAVSSNHLGASTTFVGSVRRGPEDGPVQAIEYTAYEEMAEAELARIVSEATERWPHVELAVQHRLGLVSVGEASVAVVAGAPHRDQAFEACRYVIEELKKRVPIWKKEVLDGGVERWREDGADAEGKR